MFLNFLRSYSERERVHRKSGFMVGPVINASPNIHAKSSKSYSKIGSQT